MAQDDNYDDMPELVDGPAPGSEVNTLFGNKKYVRDNLIGMRVDMAGRTVITSDRSIDGRRFCDICQEELNKCLGHEELFAGGPTRRDFNAWHKAGKAVTGGLDRVKEILSGSTKPKIPVMDIINDD